jgi:uncharacterized protein with von Willebrand factor type A (vWA) domain
MDTPKKEYQQTNFMITDGKPSCVREKMEAIIWIAMAWTNILLINVTVRQQARKLHSITTFMIANDPYLQQFVNKFTKPIR